MEVTSITVAVFYWQETSHRSCPHSGRGVIQVVDTRRLGHGTHLESVSPTSLPSSSPPHLHFHPTPVQENAHSPSMQLGTERELTHMLILGDSLPSMSPISLSAERRSGVVSELFPAVTAHMCWAHMCTR